MGNRDGDEFSKAKVLGRDLTELDYYDHAAQAECIKNIEQDLSHAKLRDEKRGIVGKRIELLVDKGTFLSLGDLFNPEDNSENTTGVETGLAYVQGRPVCIIASNPEIRKGAWLPGQPQKIFRIQEIAELLHAPILWLLECSGLDLDRQDRVYAGRHGGGRIFYNNARLAAKGIPIIEGIFGTNPAGGGYHGISATTRIAHKDATMAVGGAAILSGMKGARGFGEEDVDVLLEELRGIKKIPAPGSAAIHTETGFFEAVYETEEEVIAAMHECVAALPQCKDTRSPRAARPPLNEGWELSYLLPDNPKKTYDIEDVLACLLDGSTFCEYRPDYGPEIYCGRGILDGFPVGVIANRQGLLPAGYPEYAEYPGMGGKLYRQGLLKMCRFVLWCNAQKMPMVWLQDTSGIDVGDEAERACLLGLGQALIYAIENSQVPMATVILRKGHAAAHYVMCGPQASTNAFTLGTPLTEIVVMHGESAAMARYGRDLEKAQGIGQEQVSVVLQKMNALVEKYHNTSRPHACAKNGLVDEIVAFFRIRAYLSWFLKAAHVGAAISSGDSQNLWTLWPKMIEEQ